MGNNSFPLTNYLWILGENYMQFSLILSLVYLAGPFLEFLIDSFHSFVFIIVNVSSYMFSDSCAPNVCSILFFSFKILYLCSLLWHYGVCACVQMCVVPACECADASSYVCICMGRSKDSLEYYSPGTHYLVIKPFTKTWTLRLG